MKNLYLSTLCLFQILILSAQPKADLVSTIDHVTVFLGGAQIFREGTIDLPTGKSIIRVTALSPYIDPKSIQIKSPDNVMTVSVSHQLNQAPGMYKSKTMDSLAIVLNKIEKKTSKLEFRIEVIEQTKQMLINNQKLGGETVGVSIDQLQDGLILFEKSLMLIESEKWESYQKLDSLQRASMNVQSQMATIRGTPIVSTSEIEFGVKTEAPTKATLEISYVVKNAGWHPRYDVRSKDIIQPIQLIYKADVYQQTGEKWENVKLKFTTGSPYERQTAPELTPWKLTYRNNTVLRRIGPTANGLAIRNLSGRVLDRNGEPLIFANVMVDGHSLGTQTDMDGNFSILVPKEAKNLNVTYTGYSPQQVTATGSYVDVIMEEGMLLESAVVTGSGINREKKNLSYATTSIAAGGLKQTIEMQPVIVFENQIITEFELDVPATIPSDGKTINLDIASYEIPANYVYESTPKADKGAYLIATLIDWERFHLMEGEANLYFNNTYIGKTIIDPASFGDTLELSLGRDPDIILERIKEEEFTKKTFLGTNIIVEKRFKISIRNKKQYPIEVLITDQIPVSVNDAIVVSPILLSDGLLEEASGIVTWRLKIEKEQTKNLILNYTVKYPGKESVILE